MGDPHGFPSAGGALSSRTAPSVPQDQERSDGSGEDVAVLTCGLPAAYTSADGYYRYDLLRYWGPEDGPQVCWVMLNPSTADATQDDPTIRRCIAFSKAWGFDSLIVVNLFALRATDPKALLTSVVSPIGPENDETIDRAVANAQRTVCAWGTKGTLRGRAATVTQRLVGQGHTLDALAITKDGHPKHPLYVKGDTIPTVYRRGHFGGTRAPIGDAGADDATSAGVGQVGHVFTGDTEPEGAP